MFGHKVTEKDELEASRSDVRTLQQQMKELRSTQEIEIKKLKADHEIALMKAKAETDNAVLEAKNQALKEITEVRKRNAVLEAEAVLQGKMLDLNADVLDVKDLVSKLIEALPKVNITGGLALGAGSCKSE